MYREQIVKEVTDLMQIVYRINRSFSHSCPVEQEFALPPSQLHALIAIRKQQPLNMTSLAEHLLITRQQLTRVVDSLVEKGFVERTVDPENRRQILLQLSEEGTQFVHQLIYDGPNLLSRLLEVLDEREATRFLEAISTLKDVLYKLDQQRKALADATKSSALP